MKKVLTFAGFVTAGLLIPGGVDDFRLDVLTSREIWGGGDPYFPFAGFSHVRLPAAHLLQLPLGLIPEGYERAASLLLVAAGWTVVVWLLFPRFWWAGPFVSMLWPFYQVDHHGHLTPWWVVLLVFAYRMVESRPWLAGLMLAAVVSFRLFPWPIVAGLVVAGMMAGWWAGGWFALLNVVGVWLPGVSVAGTLAAMSEGAGLFVPNDGNLSAARVMPYWVLAVPLVWLVVWGWGKDWRRVWGPSVVVSLLAAPLVWATYLPVLLAASSPTSDGSDIPIQREKPPDPLGPRG